MDIQDSEVVRHLKQISGYLRLLVGAAFLAIGFFVLAAVF